MTRAKELASIEVYAEDDFEERREDVAPLELPRPAGTEHIIQIGGAVIQKPRRFRNMPRPVGLQALELSYFRSINALIVRAKNLANGELAKVLIKALGQAEARLTFDDRLVFDDGTTEVERAIEDARAQFLMERSDENLDKLIRNHGLAVNNRNRENFRRTFKQVMGVDVLAAEPWLQEEVQAFMRENSSFIKSISDEYLSDVEQIVFRNVKAGNAPSVLARELGGAFDLTQNRARLIARDQTGKFHSRLTRLRYEGVGLKRYIWRTLADSRVRDDHDDLEGTEHEFANPPVTVTTGKRAGQRNNPGEDIQCRCWAEVIFADLLKA